jgi:hypothetical protein
MFNSFNVSLYLYVPVKHGYGSEGKIMLVGLTEKTERRKRR